MTLQELRDRRREEILRVAAHRGARNVRVFGSVARGDNDEKSDVDFLVEMEPGRTRPSSPRSRASAGRGSAAVRDDRVRLSDILEAIGHPVLREN
jgi:predicted nucleotidyltransferase